MRAIALLLLSVLPLLAQTSNVDTAQTVDAIREAGIRQQLAAQGYDQGYIDDSVRKMPRETDVHWRTARQIIQQQKNYSEAQAEIEAIDAELARRAALKEKEKEDRLNTLEKAVADLKAQNEEILKLLREQAQKPSTP